MLAELSEFVSKEYRGFEGKDSALFVYAFAAIDRYHSFLVEIRTRNRAVSAAYAENFEALVAGLRGQSGSSRLSQREQELYAESDRLGLLVQLEQESFYTFAKTLLDKIAHAVWTYFGRHNAPSLQSHHKWITNVNTYAASRGLVVPHELVGRMKKLQVDISDFRDDHIAHEKNPRTMRGMNVDPDGTVRMGLGVIYPNERDRQYVASRSVDELMIELEDYIRSIIQFVQTNSSRTALFRVQPGNVSVEAPVRGSTAE